MPKLTIVNRSFVELAKARKVAVGLMVYEVCFFIRKPDL